MSMFGAAGSIMSVQRRAWLVLLLVASTLGGGAAFAQSAAGTLVFSSGNYFDSQGTAATVTLSVMRNGGSRGAVTVGFATIGGSAADGVDYTGVLGTLKWADGDGTAKTIVVPLHATAPFAGNRSFSVKLIDVVGGAALGAPKAFVNVIGSQSVPAGAFHLRTLANGTLPSNYQRFAVNRGGGDAGPVSVQYMTLDESAKAGIDYDAVGGTLQWAAGDSSSREIDVPITGTGSVSRYFTLMLYGPTGGAVLGAPDAQIATVPGSFGLVASSGGTSPAISVSGSELVDAQGNPVQLRGVNVSGLEGVAIMGWSPSNPWGGATGTPTPDWTTIKSWGSNVVRLPLNEASWLGLSCVDVGGIGKTVTNGVQVQNKPGTTIKADPGGNYRATVASSVADAGAAGLYVILDLHLAAPGDVCPTLQNAMADADHSLAFWTSVATAFKGSPNVIFELFNEPFLDMTTTLVDSTPWRDLLNGGATLNAYYAQQPEAPWTISRSFTWHTAGMQQMLDAVRATGATNVVLTSTLSYAGAIYDWLEYKPTDPIHQLAAVWHAYSVPQYPHQVDCVNMPGCSATIMDAAVAIKAAGYPVVITEYGDTIGGATAPWASVLLPFADAHNISYLGWTWDVWGAQTANDLILDASGTPTQGYGTYVKAHYLCRAAGTATCP